MAVWPELNKPISKEPLLFDHYTVKCIIIINLPTYIQNKENGQEFFSSRISVLIIIQCFIFLASLYNADKEITIIYRHWQGQTHKRRRYLWVFTWKGQKWIFNERITLWTVLKAKKIQVKKSISWGVKFSILLCSSEQLDQTNYF